MSIGNIYDKRTNKYDVRCDAMFEPSCQDNKCKNATQFPYDKGNFEMGVDQMDNTTVEVAIHHAIHRWNIPVTVYLYDVGENHHYSTYKASPETGKLEKVWEGYKNL